MRLFAKANYQVIAKRRFAYVLSAALLTIGIAAMIINSARGAGWVDYGVDFTGGVLMQVRFEQPVTIEQVRSALRTTRVSSVTRLGEESEYVIRAPAVNEGEVDQVANDIVAVLSGGLPGTGLEVVRSDLVGPKVGGELERKAAMAVGLSFLLTLIYLAFRFETRFGLAAIIATAHDILLTLGLIAVFRIEVSVTTVASILTVVGYSLNDTIIVFDRIRENFRKTRHTASAEPELVNRSINETLPRTVLTSGTTVAVLIPLFLFGGVVLRDFALVLIVGIVFGTYSSIFIASPALIEVRRWTGFEKHGGRKPQPAAEQATAGLRNRRPAA
ncbi:MAG TPA: protein translocase subunit SecF [Gemmatimonadota bacterium]|nr:protein translocase subunit SecF [Gemmatimonadota bacterium]